MRRRLASPDSPLPAPAPAQPPPSTPTEEALFDSEARYRAIVDTASDAIFTVDEHGIIEFANPAAERLFGWPVDQLAGSRLSRLIPPPHSEKHDAYIAGYLKTGVSNVVGGRREVTGLRRNGSTFPIELAVSEVRLSGRRLFTGIARDLSERRTLEESLRFAQKMEALGILAGGIAHDFNSILNIILWHAELVATGLPAEHPVQEEAAGILRAAEKGANLTRRLLAFSRKQVSQPVPLRLNDIVEDMRDMLKGSLGHAVLLELDLAPDLAPIRADPGQMEQVLINLVMNARDAMPDGGRILVRTENHCCPAAGQLVHLTVIDEGHGIDSAHLDRIFEPFFTTKEPGKGTGLGLPTVYGIVKQQGGTLEVESRVGEGALFRVCLPTAGE